MSAPTGFCYSPNNCFATVCPITTTSAADASSSGVDLASGVDPPVRHRRIIRADALNLRGPVLIAELGLAGLADEVTDLADGHALALDRLRVVGCERGGAAGARAHAARRPRARQYHDQIGAEPFDLLAHRVIGALADGDHGDQSRDADEDAEHGQGRPHHVAPDRLHGSSHDHHGKAPESIGASCAGDVRTLRLRHRRACAARRFGGFGQLRILHVGDDQSVAHGKGAIGISADVRFVGYDDDGDAVLAIEPHQRFHDFVRGAGIEVAGRLVGEQ